jgi:hypothetical protein
MQGLQYAHQWGELQTLKVRSLEAHSCAQKGAVGVTLHSAASLCSAWCQNIGLRSSRGQAPLKQEVSEGYAFSSLQRAGPVADAVCSHANGHRNTRSGQQAQQHQRHTGIHCN